MFQIGQAVVHPAHGPGKIVKIKKLSTLGSGKQYYSVRLLDGSETEIWVPVQDAQEHGLRTPIKKSRVAEVWRRLRAEAETLPTDHQARYQVVREKLETGQLLSIAEAIRDLSWKDYTVRGLTSEGKRLFDKGIRMLTTEVALVQGSEPQTVETKITRILDSKIAKKESE